MSNWRQKAYDSLLQQVAEWLYEIERDEYRKTTPYYSFGWSAISRYQMDALFHGRVQSLVSSLMPALDSAFVDMIGEVKDRYAK
jgi:hypothetical protein